LLLFVQNLYCIKMFHVNMYIYVKLISTKIEQKSLLLFEKKNKFVLQETFH
jgi:hypothetical protein